MSQKDISDRSYYKSDCRWMIALFVFVIKKLILSIARKMTKLQNNINNGMIIMVEKSGRNGEI